jgi:hypothetical protein
LGVRFVNPFDIPLELLRRLSEAQSLQFQAIALSRKEDEVVFAFREPPTELQVRELSQLMGAAVKPLLARPSSIDFARNRAYPRLVLSVAPVMAHAERFQHAAGVDATVLLEALSSQHAAHRSLPDMMLDMAMLSETQAREIWAQCLGCLPSTLAELTLNLEFYRQMGPVFWWLHGMLPTGPETIVTATTPHGQMAEWLSNKLGTHPDFLAELPRKIELATRRLGLEIDPDQLLLTQLVAKGALAPAQLPNLTTLRSIIAEPLPKWLMLQKLVTEEQLHWAFLEVSQLPVTLDWRPEEVRRLLPVLPTGLALETGCFCLEESPLGLRLGLAQLPSPRVLREIQDRLTGYPLYFQALAYGDAVSMRNIALHPG